MIFMNIFSSHLQLYTLYAIGDHEIFDKVENTREYVISILNGNDAEKKQIIYDKCEEYIRDDLDLYEKQIININDCVIY